MIKYIKAEKNDYEQLITVNSGNIKESEERLKRYNLSDIQIITRDDEKYLKSLSEAAFCRLQKRLFRLHSAQGTEPE